MTQLIKVNLPGKLGDEEIILRNEYTGLFVPLISYPGAEIPKKQSEKMYWFPDMKYFSPGHFTMALECVGWQYHGARYDGRDLNSRKRMKEDGSGTETETLPEDLLEYSIDAQKDLEKIIINAQKRMLAFHPLAGFSTPEHGRYLSEELYEAGWLWDYDRCRFDNNTTMIVWNMWEMDKIPDIMDFMTE